MIFVYAEIFDQDGNPVQDAEPEVTFSVTGELIGDNPFTEAGIATTLLMAGENPGTITVSAEADGLDLVELNLTTF